MELSADETSDVEEKLREIVPDDPNKPYDVKDVITNVVDKRSFYEIGENYAQNIVIGFGEAVITWAIIQYVVMVRADLLYLPSFNVSEVSSSG